MLVTKTVTLLGEQLRLQGDDGDIFFNSFPTEAELADSVITGVVPFVAEDAVCMDIGANLGVYSVAIARRFPKARMIACEPVPRTFECLQANVAANAPGVIPLQVAVGASDHTAHMNFAEHYAAGSHFSSDGSLVSIQNTGDTDIEVSVRTLDSIVADQGLPTVDLIKIDVEGYESDVLQGGRQTFAEHRPVTQIEFNSWAFTAHRKQLPQDALDEILDVFPYVYVHERHGNRFGRVSTDGDRLSLLRANMIHGCVDNLLCGFTELVPDAPPYGAVWQEFSQTPDHQIAALNNVISDLRRQLAASERERASIQETVSWRATKPLRAVRSLKR